MRSCLVQVALRQSLLLAAQSLLVLGSQLNATSWRVRTLSLNPGASTASLVVRARRPENLSSPARA